MENQKLNKRVLIVEDEAAMASALRTKFEKYGFDIIGASDGEEGLKVAMAEKPDLLMLDLLMPKMDGISLMKEVRKEATWGTTVPIIILTNLSDHESMSEAAENSVYFLVKTEWRLDDVVKLAMEKLGIV
jgi:DNA-binding response OmpR family regulator